MIASTPVRLVAVAIVALVIITGLHGIVSGIGLTGGGDLLADHGRGSPATERVDDRPHPKPQRTRGSVAYVLDGDTVQVTTHHGGTVRVRFLGISAPEIPHPGKAGECYGYASTRHLKQLLPVGAPVVLISDPTQADTDVYGRSLRYVQAGGHDIGAEQIRLGAAAARETSNPVTRHDNYLDLMRRARAEDLGMWSRCAGR